MAVNPIGVGPTLPKYVVKAGPSLFIDEPPEKELFLGFEKYVDTISEIILNSKPQYAIGLFGRWGTGKTTLLVNLEKKLMEKKCDCVQFNAWRYENEVAHATVPLLMTILANLYKKIETGQEDLLETTNKKSNEKLGDKIKRVLQGLMINFNVGIPGIGELGLNYDFSKVTPRENTSVQVKEMPSTLQKTTLHEGLDLILELIKKVNGATSNPELKLVVFIDDLDRCTPEKAVGVFESIKAFLNIRGIVFVLGLSQDIVEAAIDEKYREFAKLVDLFKGTEYLRKIIQLYITMPRWEGEQIENYLKFLLKDYPNGEYVKIFEENSKLISKAVEPNPRDLKRLLNSFIVSREIYKDKGIENSKLLALQALQLRWPKFYELSVSDPEFLQRIKKRIIK